MEQIIILIAIGLLSTLFGKKNKGAEQKQKQETQKTGLPQKQPMTQRQAMPTREATPQTRQAPSTEQLDPFKKLKELTGEIYREIQEDQRKTVTEQSMPIEPVPIPEVAMKKPAKQRPERKASTRSSGRLSTHNPDEQRFVKSESLNVDITSKQDLLKGIVFSEILGPPKSKQ